MASSGFLVLLRERARGMLVRIRDFLLDFPILLGDRTFVGRPQARCLFLVPVVARCERTSVLVVELLELQLSSGALGLERRSVS